MGTVSSSSVGNVAGTGSLTIPMMKKLGYKPEFAGAVEAAASTGGQLMPPIMGAAAFLMAEFVGTPYVNVVKAAHRLRRCKFTNTGNEFTGSSKYWVQGHHEAVDPQS